jgi:hypothetical protein
VEAFPGQDSADSARVFVCHDGRLDSCGRIWLRGNAKPHEEQWKQADRAASGNTKPGRCQRVHRESQRDRPSGDCARAEEQRREDEPGRFIREREPECDDQHRWHGHSDSRDPCCRSGSLDIDSPSEKCGRSACQDGEGCARENRNSDPWREIPRTGERGHRVGLCCGPERQDDAPQDPENRGDPELGVFHSPAFLKKTSVTVEAKVGSSSSVGHSAVSVKVRTVTSLTENGLLNMSRTASVSTWREPNLP